MTFSSPVATAELSKFAGILTAALSQDRNGMDLTEEGDITNRWQEYTEELYKKDLHNPDNHTGVITRSEERRVGKECRPCTHSNLISNSILKPLL